MKPHSHHSLSNQVSKKDLALHVLKDHEVSPKPEVITNFEKLVNYHFNAHSGQAPRYQEISDVQEDRINTRI